MSILVLVLNWTAFKFAVRLESPGPNSQLPCSAECSQDNSLARTTSIENTCHATDTRPAHWRADCCLATSYNIRPLRHSFQSCALEHVYMRVLLSTAVSVAIQFLHGANTPQYQQMQYWSWARLIIGHVCSTAHVK
jgi:hypothetical protein